MTAGSAICRARDAHLASALDLLTQYDVTKIERCGELPQLECLLAGRKVGMAQEAPGGLWTVRLSNERHESFCM